MAARRSKEFFFQAQHVAGLVVPDAAAGLRAAPCCWRRALGLRTLSFLAATAAGGGDLQGAVEAEQGAGVALCRGRRPEHVLHGGGEVQEAQQIAGHAASGRRPGPLCSRVRPNLRSGAPRPYSSSGLRSSSLDVPRDEATWRRILVGHGLTRIGTPRAGELYWQAFAGNDLVAALVAHGRTRMGCMMPLVLMDSGQPAERAFVHAGAGLVLCRAELVELF